MRGRVSVMLGAALWLGAAVAPRPVAADTVIGTYSTGPAPVGVAVSPDGSHLYVANYLADTVSVYETATMTFESAVTAIDAPFDLVVSPDGATMFVSSPVVGLARVDLATFSVSLTGFSVNQMTFSPDGSLLYATAGAGVLVFDADTGVLVSTFPSASLSALALSADGSQVFAAATSAPVVLVFDSATGAEVASVNIGGVADVAGTGPDGRVYFTGPLSSNLVVVDPETTSVVASVPVDVAQALAFTSDGTRAYVVGGSPSTDVVSVVDLATHTVADTLPVPLGAVRIALGDSFAYVTSYASNDLTVLQLDTPPAITTATLAPGRTGASYGQTIAASGVPAPTFSASGDVPPGLALAATGELAGTPTTAGTYTFTVLVASTVSGIPMTDAATFTVTIDPAAPVFTTPSALPAAVAGSPYAATIVATGEGTVTYAVTGGALPTGLVLAPDGALSGTPTAPGDYTVTVTATGVAGGLSTSTAQAFALAVAPPTTSTTSTTTSSSTLPPPPADTSLVPPTVAPTLPATGGSPGGTVVLAGLMLAAGIVVAALSHRRA